ncbi:hypothetical protein IJQ51_01065 [Candidatus Saccharibacteria bacterium]|nr:hypothetical protein [Candidatus Saccharibacteria bacterium]
MLNSISIKQYRNIKRNLEEMEKTNYDSIIIIPCSGNKGWHEFAEHSALFYYYDVCEKLRLSHRFFADTMSFYDQYEIGYMRTLSIDSIRTNLKRAKLYKSEETKSFFTIFKLNKAYRIEDVQALEKMERARRLKNLTVEEAVNLDPELHQILANLAIRLHRLCNNNLDRLSSQTRGIEIINLIDNLLVEYHQITMMKHLPKSTIAAKFTDMRKETYQLIFLTKVLGEAKIWDLEVCASISEPLIAAKAHIENNLKKFVKDPNARTAKH